MPRGGLPVNRATLAFAILSLTTPSPGAERWSRVYRWSLVALAGTQAADVATSWNGHESNPLLRGPNGRFGGRAIGLKIGIMGGTVAFQQILRRKRPQLEGAMALGNFAGAGLTGWQAGRNVQIRRGR